MRRRSRRIEAPDITPLIDVVFLLLIFFMVSTIFKRDELALFLNLPAAEHGEAADASDLDVITLELGAEDVAFNGRRTAMDGLDALLGAVGDKGVPVDVRIDRSVRYERIVRLFDKLREHRLPNVSLITER